MEFGDRLSQFSAIEASLTRASWKVEAPYWCADGISCWSISLKLGPARTPFTTHSPSCSIQEIMILTNLVASVASNYGSATSTSISGESDCCWT